MPTTFADLEEIISTVTETRAGVKWLRRAVRALLDHNGIRPGGETGDDA